MRRGDPAGPRCDLVGQASVIDGDTIEIHGQRIRLWGIDAPESAQLCRGSDSLHYRCGTVAANALSTFIACKPVACAAKDVDRYGRTVAVCTGAGVDLARSFGFYPDAGFRWLLHQGDSVPLVTAVSFSLFWRDRADKIREPEMRSLAIAAVTGSALLTGFVTADAADMAYKAAPIAMPPSVFSWTGGYIGVNVGGAWTPSNGGSDFGPLFPPFIVLPPAVAIPTVIPGQLDVLSGGGRNSGFIGGGQIGYNYQVNQFLLGVEADAVSSGLRGSSATGSRTIGAPIFAVPATQTVTVNFGEIDWMASFRGRVGFAVDRTLFYVTGGGAVAEFGGSKTTLVNGPVISTPAGTFVATNGGSTTRWGWTVGGGIEWAFNQNWSVAGEYRYTDFGNRGTTFDIPSGLAASPVFATGTGSSRLTVEQATVRLNYRFGGPVVARY